MFHLLVIDSICCGGVVETIWSGYFSVALLLLFMDVVVVVVAIAVVDCLLQKIAIFAFSF